ncbi:MAG: hypothetical protein KTR25_10080 [Myxococcales bacterium]|nr:hypothetical protein [Myxococcales bacterium]
MDEANTTRLLFTYIAVAGLGVHTLSEAQASPADLRKARIAIPTANAKPDAGGTALINEIKSVLRPYVGELVSTRAMQTALKNLRQTKRKKQSLDLHHAIAMQVQANWLIHVNISYRSYLYTVKARLVRVVDKDVVATIRSEFYAPGQEATDRGRQLGLRFLEILTKSKAAPTPSPPPVATVRPEENRPPPRRAKAAPKTNRQRRPRENRPSSLGTSPDSPAKREETQLSDSSTVKPTPSASKSDPDRSPPKSQSPRNSLSVRKKRERAIAAQKPTSNMNERKRRPRPKANLGAAESNKVVPQLSPPASSWYIALNAGAAIFRQYDLASGSVDRSDLSYRLGPQPLVNLYGQWQSQSTPWTIDMGASFRPFARKVLINSDDAATSIRPQGYILDGQLSVGYTLPLSKNGNRSFLITPKLGTRVTINPIDDHIGPVLLSSSLVTILAGSDALIPLSDRLEIQAGIDAGAIVMYEESPADSGDAGTGLSANVNLGFRFWINTRWAFTVDGQFIYDQIWFSGQPSREIPPVETPFEDAQIRFLDLQTSVGLALRL